MFACRWLSVFASELSIYYLGFVYEWLISVAWDGCAWWLLHFLGNFVSSFIVQTIAVDAWGIKQIDSSLYFFSCQQYFLYVYVKYFTWTIQINMLIFW